LESSQNCLEAERGQKSFNAEPRPVDFGSNAGMKVVIAGGSGFLGTALVERLKADRHEVRVLSRRPRGPHDIAWTPDGTAGAWASALDDADAVVNLAGESIASGRWTTARKARIRDSRLQATRSLVAAMQRAARPPSVFISGSAVGYYGPRGEEPVTEHTPPGDDFLATVCRDWEAEARRAADFTRLVLLRTGIVLAREGGALPPMALPFKLFAGGPVGSGRQYQPWIHRDDWVTMTAWSLRTAAVMGPLNVTAPNPVTNREFAQTLGRVLGRPAFMPAPAIAMKLVLGEMAEALLLTGARVIPAQAQASGFHFQFPTLEPALRAIYTAR
jgi:uncharacterized protein (TIGR01777 family)